MAQYLKSKSNNSFFNPFKELCKVALYTGVCVYGHENQTDTSCVKSITGYCIAFIKFLLLW